MLEQSCNLKKEKNNWKLLKKLYLSIYFIIFACFINLFKLNSTQNGSKKYKKFINFKLPTVLNLPIYQILSHKNVSLHDLYKKTLSIGNLCLFRWTWWLLAGGFYRLPISIFMVWNSRSVYAKVFWVKEFQRFKYLMSKYRLDGQSDKSIHSRNLTQTYLQ